MASDEAWLAGIQLTRWPVRSTAVNYPIVNSDYAIIATAACTVTLPTSIGISGKWYVIKSTTTGNVVVATTALQTIDGDLTKTIYIKYTCMYLLSDGANWHVM